MKKTVYLDYAAATPVHPEVIHAMMPFYEEIYGNPSALHSAGRNANKALTEARIGVAEILDVSPAEIIFCSSGTESVNLALQGVLRAAKGRGKHVITTGIEHHAVLHTLDYLSKEGWETTFVPVNRYGQVSPDSVVEAMRPDTVLVTIMHANNEIGTINPIADITRAVKQNNPKVFVHTDACQSSGYIPFTIPMLGVDLLTANGSKIYGPKGSGILYVKKTVMLHPVEHGGGQEMNRRSGTENLAAIVGFSKALKIARTHAEEESARLSHLRDYFIDEIFKNIPKTILNGHPTERLPHNVNVSFLDIEGEALLLYLDNAGIYASTGSACTSGSLEPSHVVVGIGLSYEAAHGSMRFTLGKSTTRDDIDYVMSLLPNMVASLRKISPINLDINDFLDTQFPVRYSK